MAHRLRAKLDPENHPPRPLTTLRRRVVNASLSTRSPGNRAKATKFQAQGKQCSQLKNQWQQCAGCLYPVAFLLSQKARRRRGQTMGQSRRHTPMLELRLEGSNRNKMIFSYFSRCTRLSQGGLCTIGQRPNRLVVHVLFCTRTHLMTLTQRQWKHH